MIVLGTLCGIGVLAAGLAASDLLGKRKAPRLHRAIDIAESRTFTGGMNGMYRPGTREYFPPPDDGRPQ